MSRDAYNQFLELQHIMVALPPANHDSKDVWHFIWGPIQYFSSKYYHYHFKNLHPNRIVLWI
jgi:hypothetical protein